MDEVELDLPGEHDVAVVVFARAAGVDASDAAHRVSVAIGMAIGKELPLLHRHATVKGRTIKIANVLEVGMAAGNGYLWTCPTGKAALYAGWDEEQEATDGK